MSREDWKFIARAAIHLWPFYLMILAFVVFALLEEYAWREG